MSAGTSKSRGGLCDASGPATAEEWMMVSRSQPCGDGSPPILPQTSEPSAAVIGRCLPKTWEDYRRPAFPLHVGAPYEAWHPFKLEAYQPIPDDLEAGYPDKVNTWVPGWRYEPSGPEDMEEVWDGEGLQRRTIVSFHRPSPRYPERVFYTRQWIDPNGRAFGKANLRCVIAPTFRAWLRGERWPDHSPARRAHIAWATTPSQDGTTGRNDQSREAK